MREEQEAPAGGEVLIRLESISLSDGPTRVALLGVVGPRGDRSAAGTLAAVGDRSLSLVVRGLRAEAAPGVLYHLFLNLPEKTGTSESPPGSLESRSVEATAPSADDFRLVGSLNFYAARPAAESGGGTGRPAFTFDVSAVIRALHDRGLLGQALVLTIVPSGPPTPGAKPSIASLELVAG